MSAIEIAPRLRSGFVQTIMSEALSESCDWTEILDLGGENGLLVTARENEGW